MTMTRKKLEELKTYAQICDSRAESCIMSAFKLKELIALAERALPPQPQEEQSCEMTPEQIMAALRGADVFYAVLNPSGNEGVLFKDKMDAEYTATGVHARFGVPTLGDTFRECYADDGKMSLREVVLQSAASQLALPAGPVRELQHSDDIAVDRFAAAMKQKLARAREKGRGGWEHCSQAALSRMLREHVNKGDPRDVANFCMMLWNNGVGIAAVPPWVSPAVAQPQYQEWDADGRYAALEKEHLGDPEKRTGIYHPDNYKSPAVAQPEPDWSDSKTLISEAWKNPLTPMGERLQIADGAVRFRDDVIANLRKQLAEAQAAVAQPVADEREARDAARWRAMRVTTTAIRNSKGDRLECTPEELDAAADSYIDQQARAALCQPADEGKPDA